MLNRSPPKSSKFDLCSWKCRFWNGRRIWDGDFHIQCKESWKYRSEHAPASTLGKTELF